MIERGYSIRHLTTDQLRELFMTYREQGWLDFEYYQLVPEGLKPKELSDEQILSNIHAGSKHNYFVFMLGNPDEADGIMIGFGLRDYTSFGAYLHLKEDLLDEIIERYDLKEIEPDVTYLFPEISGKDIN